MTQPRPLGEPHRNWDVVMLQMYLFKSIEDDILPPMNMAGFFGMGSTEEKDLSDRSLDVHVFGVWQVMRKYGLMPKRKRLDAIRKNQIQSFFEDAVKKLADIRHGYSMKVIDESVHFDPLPRLGVEFKPNCVYDLKYAVEDALSAYQHPCFQTETTQEAAWVRVENLLTTVMDLPAYKWCPDSLETMRFTMNSYKALKEHYGLKRVPTKDMKVCAEMIRALPDSDTDSE